MSLQTNQDLDPSRLRRAFGIFPSGVVAVAAEVDGRLVGLAASSFTSVSLEPPLVSFSVANTSKTWPDLRRTAHLGVTILADHHGEVCRQLDVAAEEDPKGFPEVHNAEPGNLRQRAGGGAGHRVKYFVDLGLAAQKFPERVHERGWRRGRQQHSGPRPDHAKPGSRGVAT